MCYKISNTADRTAIERSFDISFKYPKLHKPKPVINGLAESSVLTINQNNQSEVTLAIWGLLPESFQEDWQVYQDIKNTLNIDVEEIDQNSDYIDALQHRRCIVIVTGFFTYYLHDGELYPYYVYSETEEPFGLAAVYNELEDGFTTASILVSEANDFIKKIHNADALMPVILNKDDHNLWLDAKTESTDLELLFHTPNQLKLTAHPIAKEFHKSDIIYDSVLDPVEYKNIPNIKRIRRMD
ncbi:SOS response-associated peptidase [Changchengzhania lutea]|uniref:SOS response-associated peptidase n=1 Tax=Changchengzhania lutea TaxID=2049305 RepID=UPI00115CCF11|nr:SOS response-associated peptidase family protein [Changchengzhania lutea]